MSGSRFGVLLNSERALLDQFVALKQTRASARKIGNSILAYIHHHEDTFGEKPDVKWAKIAVELDSPKMVQALLDTSSLSHEDAVEAINFGVMKNARPSLLNKIGIAAVELEYRNKDMGNAGYTRIERSLSYELMKAVDTVNKRADFITTRFEIRQAGRKSRELKSLSALVRLREANGFYVQNRIDTTSSQPLATLTRA